MCLIVLSPRITHSRIIGEGPRISREPIHPDKSAYSGYFLDLWLHCPGRTPMELRVPSSVDPESPRITPDSTRFNYESAQNVPRTRQECDLKFESFLSVPNESRLNKNVPRLRPDVGDGATNSADSARMTPESSARIFLPSAPSEPRVSHD